MSNSESFLPRYVPRGFKKGTHDKLWCIKRGKEVRATPEEKVRQRVLNWLTAIKKWDIKSVRLEQSYDWVGDPNRHRIRPDIELLDENENPLVVIECKAPNVPLSDVFERQAREYAIKSKSPWVWITNGDQHQFFTRKARSRGSWIEVRQIEPLGTQYVPQQTKYEVPEPNDRRAVKKYMRENDFDKFEDDDQEMVLAFRRLFFATKKVLPFSFDGVHILEDWGIGSHSFGNASGGTWRGLYSDYIAATAGSVEPLSVNVIPRDDGGIRLCVGVRKVGRSHIALELDTKVCERDNVRSCWKIFHNGLMSRVKKEIVFQAVEESGAGDWLYEKNGKTCVYLGELHPPSQITWRNSKKLLANLLHYALIRSNLREAIAARQRQD